MGATVVSLGLLVPSAQAAPAAAQDCAATHTVHGKVKASHTAVIRPKPVKSEANGLGQINKGDTVTLVNGNWDEPTKKCTYFVRNGEKNEVCSPGDPTTWYHTVWVERYKRIGYVPAACHRG
ncbi:hypothetical protein [Allokutzneria oryzae]|uniref:SH3 domain-containing protein n=1 Tax=Allokutzneria oryzae TaxID=1378989 RepID=A0ABV5ZT57_9PSEU